MIDVKLTDEEVRVLGCLIEKEMTTPEYYPLSLNSLVNACNQKSNREPVVSYDEQTVLRAIEDLKGKDLAWQSDLGRVAKYSHNFLKSQNLVNKEAAILCILFLRGHQTAGEIRERTERLYKFNTIDEAKEVLNNLEEIGYVKLLPRQPGLKEPRYSHLLSDAIDDVHEHPSTELTPHAVSHSNLNNLSGERISHLEEEVARLRRELEELRRQFTEFRGQF